MYETANAAEIEMYGSIKLTLVVLIVSTQTGGDKQSRK